MIEELELRYVPVVTMATFNQSVQCVELYLMDALEQ